MGSQNPLKPSPAKQKTNLREKTTLEIVWSINLLLTKARTENLATVTTILEDARESIAWWAVNDNYNEHHIETFIYHMTHENGLYTALEFLAKLAAVKDDVLRGELLEDIQKIKRQKAV